MKASVTSRSSDIMHPCISTKRLVQSYSTS